MKANITSTFLTEKIGSDLNFRVRSMTKIKLCKKQTRSTANLKDTSNVIETVM